jgi:hypothetical protein
MGKKREKMGGGVCACYCNGTVQFATKTHQKKNTTASSVYDCTVEDVEYIYNM